MHWNNFYIKAELNRKDTSFQQNVLTNQIKIKKKLHSILKKHLLNHLISNNEK